MLVPFNKEQGKKVQSLPESPSVVCVTVGCHTLSKDHVLGVIECFGVGAHPRDCLTAHNDDVTVLT